jgi:DnaK suppressor protein
VDPEHARKRLTEERARIEQELAEHGHVETSLDEPEDFGDKAAELEQADTERAIVEDLRRTLAAIERAEQRLEDGSYGKSVVSGEPIPDGRLEVIPWAERTVEEEKGVR